MYEMSMAFINLMNGSTVRVNYMFKNFDDACDRAKWFSTFENVTYIDIIDLMTGEVLTSYAEGRCID